MTHDGTNGILRTDIGHLLLSPAVNVGIGTTSPSERLDVAGGRIGGVECELGEGKAVWIGPGVTHEFWTEGEEVAEGVLVMFGEGA